MTSIHPEIMRELTYENFLRTMSLRVRLAALICKRFSFQTLLSSMEFAKLNKYRTRYHSRSEIDSMIRYINLHHYVLSYY